MLPARRTQSGGRVARRNGPVARSTRPLSVSFRLNPVLPLAKPSH
jgi:hypothetical protein